MPHLTTPRSTISELRATGLIDPSFAHALQEMPVPSGADYGADIEPLKDLAAMGLPRLQATLAASRPDGLDERVIYVDLPSRGPSAEAELRSSAAGGGRTAAWRSRVIVCSRQTSLSRDVEKAAVMVLFFGGGQTLGNPENELVLARRLVERYNLVVFLPSYRLAPEYVFPAAFDDSFEILKIIAASLTALGGASASASIPAPAPAPAPNSIPRSILNGIDPALGFIVGGTSAGATISSAISYLYHDYQTANSQLRLPDITALYLSCGTYTPAEPSLLPVQYRPYYLSPTENKRCLPFDSDLINLFMTTAKVDPNHMFMSSIRQPDHHWLRKQGVKVYFQACGRDISRDSTLIFERFLREEVHVTTRLDLYAGWGHCWWSMGGKWAELAESTERMEHTVEGVGWCLARPE